MAGSKSSDRDRRSIKQETTELLDALIQINTLSESDRASTVHRAANTIIEQRELIEQLIAKVRWLSGKPYRPSREKVAPGQLALDLLGLLVGDDAKKDDNGDNDDNDDNDDGENGENGENGQTAENDEKSKSRRKKRPKRVRRGAELPVNVVENRKDDADRVCATCHKREAEMGYDVQRRIVYEPAKLSMLEERCFKYACPDGCGGVDRAEPTLPAKPIPGSMASSSLLAHLIVGKLLDGLPIERQAKQMRRHGADLAVSTLNSWMGQAAAMFTLLHARFRNELLASDLISLDDTPLLALSRGHPRGTIRGRQWIYLGDVDRVAYVEYTPDWKGTHPRAVLDGYSGKIQNDAYGGINPLFNADGTGPKRVGCNDHARRKYVHALQQGDARAQPVIDLYKALYRVEADAKKAGADAAELLARRRATSEPLWQQLETTIAKLANNVRKKSSLGKAIIYSHRQAPHLRAFLDDGSLPISNAHVERRIRTVALVRKNSLFYGSVDAGKRYAVLFTLVLNCILVGANPYDYLVDVIDKIAADWQANRIRELMPRNWLDARQRQNQLNSDAVA
jgi:transposase